MRCPPIYRVPEEMLPPPSPSASPTQSTVSPSLLRSSLSPMMYGRAQVAGKGGFAADGLGGCHVGTVMAHWSDGKGGTAGFDSGCRKSIADVNLPPE
ncbi:hypothetical protein ACLOJK_036967 [Asimina triloba]